MSFSPCSVAPRNPNSLAFAVNGAVAEKVEMAFRSVPFIVDIDNSYGQPARRLRMRISTDDAEFFHVEESDVFDTIGDILGYLWTAVADAVNFAVTLAFVTTVFAMIYKWMPRTPVAWRDVWIGALITALLFTVGKTLIGLYIGRSAVASVFGAASSLVVLLLWVYYSAQVFLLGAEFTRVFAHRGELKKSSAGPAGP